MPSFRPWSRSWRALLASSAQRSADRRRGGIQSHGRAWAVAGEMSANPGERG
jgi:hypothetical protein